LPDINFKNKVTSRPSGNHKQSSVHTQMIKLCI